MPRAAPDHSIASTGKGMLHRQQPGTPRDSPRRNSPPPRPPAQTSTTLSRHAASFFRPSIGVPARLPGFQQLQAQQPGQTVLVEIDPAISPHERIQRAGQGLLTPCGQLLQRGKRQRRQRQAQYRRQACQFGQPCAARPAHVVAKASATIRRCAAADSLHRTTPAPAPQSVPTRAAAQPPAQAGGIA